jgi:hypothetical protein
MGRKREEEFAADLAESEQRGAKRRRFGMKDG